MSLLRKSELRLRLGPRHCEAQLWQGAWRQRLVASAAVQDTQEPVTEALDALLAQGVALPRQARVCVEDELLYYALLPVQGPWRAAEAAARAHFAAVVGDVDLAIASSLAPCGRLWVTVATPRQLIDELAKTLGERDIQLRQLSAALLDDLHLVSRQLPEDGVVALLRAEGAMVIGLRGGSVADIAWERCELTQLGALGARVRGFCTRFAMRPPAWTGPARLPLLVMAGDRSRDTLAAALAQSLRARVLEVAPVADVEAAVAA